MLTPAGSLATKLCAFQDRGVEDPYLSSDLEDIALLLACCSSLEASVQSSAAAVKEIIVARGRQILEAYEDSLEGHIPRRCDEAAVFALLERLTVLPHS